MIDIIRHNSETWSHYDQTNNTFLSNFYMTIINNEVTIRQRSGKLLLTENVLNITLDNENVKEVFANGLELSQRLKELNYKAFE